MWCNRASRNMYPASHALKLHSLERYHFLPKEALAIVNGTAPSCAVAACVLHDASFCLLMAQVQYLILFDYKRSFYDCIRLGAHRLSSRSFPGNFGVIYAVFA